MKKIIIFCFLLFTVVASYAQDKNVSKENKVCISMHYIGNNRNNNFVSDNFNGIVGVDAKYKFYNNHNYSIQAGLGLDYFEGRKVDNQFKLENSLMITPNIGIVFEGSKVFHPFLNIGYSLFTAKYQLQQSFSASDPFDPIFSPIPSSLAYNFDSFTINPGLQLYINKSMYFQTDYKYLPIGSNINVHLISIGFGLTL
jgi:hypothetical protein